MDPARSRTKKCGEGVVAIRPYAGLGPNHTARNLRGSSQKGSSSLIQIRFHFVNSRANIGLYNSRGETTAGYISNHKLWFMIDAKEQPTEVLADHA